MKNFLASENARVLLHAPSIALVKLMIPRVVRIISFELLRVYPLVCSDKTVGKVEIGQTTSDLQRSPTTNPTEIAKVLKESQIYV